MLHGNKANKNVDNTSSNNFGMKEKRYLIKQKIRSILWLRYKFMDLQPNYFFVSRIYLTKSSTVGPTPGYRFIVTRIARFERGSPIL